MALDIQEMQRLQQALQERYAGWWEPVDPEHGKIRCSGCWRSWGGNPGGKAASNE